jgi:phage shock protein C
MTASANFAPFRRVDTILGVCQAIGDDFGFNPLWLRIALAAPVMVHSWYGVAVYGVLAVAVFASRFLAPVPEPRERADAAVAAPKALNPANEDAPLAQAA